MPRSGLILAAIVPFLSWQAGAADSFDDGWYVSPMLSWIDDDAARNMDDGLVGGHLGFGKALNQRSSVEFSVVAAFFNADGFDLDQQQWGLGADYIRRLTDAQYFVPYALVGGGFIRTISTQPDMSGSGLMASFGIGVLTPLNVFDLNLRTELRLRNEYSVGARQDFLLSFGLQRIIHPKRVSRSDSDSDGVLDEKDMCGDSPAGHAVDDFGCRRSVDVDNGGE